MNLNSGKMALTPEAFPVYWKNKRSGMPVVKSVNDGSGMRVVKSVNDGLLPVQGEVAWVHTHPHLCAFGDVPCVGCGDFPDDLQGHQTSKVECGVSRSPGAAADRPLSRGGSLTSSAYTRLS